MPINISPVQNKMGRAARRPGGQPLVDGGRTAVPGGWGFVWVFFEAATDGNQLAPYLLDGSPVPE
jgi:hypothetical protein